MAVNWQIQFLSQHGHVAEGFVADGVRGVRRQCPVHSGFIAEFFACGYPQFDVLLCVCGITGWKFNDCYAVENPRTHVQRGLRDLIGVEIHVVEGGGATLKHFCHSKHSAVVYKFCIDEFSLKWPHSRLQPVMQGQVVGCTTQQVHCSVGVAVD